MGWPGGQHLLFAVNKIAGVKCRQLETVAMRDCVRRAGLHAVPAKDTSIVVDVINSGVTLRAADPILRGVVCCLNIDAIRWAVGCAKEARYALFESIFVALQNVRAPESGFDPRSAQRTFAIGIVLHSRGLEHLHESDAHAPGNGCNILEYRHTSRVYRKPLVRRYAPLLFPLRKIQRAGNQNGVTIIHALSGAKSLVR
jgi:hypothetical protein